MNNLKLSGPQETRDSTDKGLIRTIVCDLHCQCREGLLCRCCPLHLHHLKAAHSLTMSTQCPPSVFNEGKDAPLMHVVRF